MAYAFRVFAAVYGHEVWDGKARNQSQGVLRCVYGGAAEDTDRSSCLRIPARYVLRPPEQPAPKPALCSYAGESLYLFYGQDKTSGSPDWLGEIFEWLSGADEMSVRERDSIGRVPYRPDRFLPGMGFPRCDRMRRLIMAWFENFISGQEHSENLPAAPSPAARCQAPGDFLP